MKSLKEVGLRLDLKGSSLERGREFQMVGLEKEKENLPNFSYLMHVSCIFSEIFLFYRRILACPDRKNLSHWIILPVYLGSHFIYKIKKNLKLISFLLQDMHTHIYAHRCKLNFCFLQHWSRSSTEVDTRHIDLSSSSSADVYTFP